MKRFSLFVTLVILATASIAVVFAQESDNEQHYADIGQQVVETFWNTSSTLEEMRAMEAEFFAQTYQVHGFFEDQQYEVTNGSVANRHHNTYFQRLGDMRANVENVFIAADAVTVIASIEATVPRPLAWGRSGFFIPPSDEPISWEYIGVFHFNQDGLIDEVWRFVDMLSVEKAN